MRFITLTIAALLLVSCNREDANSNFASQNKLLLLQVDFETNVFEAGTELNFNSTAPFSIGSSYQSPGDFGGIQLYYDNANQPIFEGSIVWSGLGERSYPTQLQAANTFPTLAAVVPQPNASLFETVDYDEFAYYPDNMDITALWQAIDQLEIVGTYRANNPNSSIHLFLYTPSVGDGDPADWDWYIMFKN
jgi:hypothetical protein